MYSHFDFPNNYFVLCSFNFILIRFILNIFARVSCKIKYLTDLKDFIKSNYFNSFFCVCSLLHEQTIEADI